MELDLHPARRKSPQPRGNPKVITPKEDMTLENSAAFHVTPGLPWQVRAVQLDLARQMETVAYIRHFIDFSAAHGYNMLVLYLEGVVSTPAFHLRPAQASYTLEQMDEVVQYARGAGINVVPAINTLGHAELFFAEPGLRHLAEERDGQTRFGGDGMSTFCPSLPETYAFLEQYLSELAQVFTGPHLHIGCDEAWNMGFCRLCAARRQRDGLASLFTEHLRRMKEIGGKLGKRLWIWDDMYELFPDALEQMPRDIVMTHWQYDPVIEPEGIQAHFRNRWRRDWLAEYARLGIDAVICPSTSLANVETFTDYGRRHPLLGGLLTQWGDTATLGTELAPLIAYTGRLWSGKEYAPERIWAESISALQPEAPEALSSIIRTLYSMPGRFPAARVQTYLAGPLSENERQGKETARLALAAVRQVRREMPAQAAVELLDELETLARLYLLSGELRELLPRIYDPRRPDGDLPRLQQMADACRKEFAALQTRLETFYARRRAGLSLPSHSVLARVASGLQPAWERLARPVRDDDWWLVLRLFLPDAFGAPRLRASVIIDGEAQTLLEGSYKANYQLTDCYYTVQVPFSSARPPEAVRLEVWGHGGQGITYLEAQNRTLALHPQQANVLSGVIEHPEAVLSDDSLDAYLGYRSIAAMMDNPALLDDHAVLEVTLG